MEKHPTEEFLEAIGGDEKLSMTMRDAVGDRRGSNAAEAIAGFAQSHGYNVDVAGIRQVHQACIEAAAKSRDLTEAELEGVDGGLVFESLAVIAFASLVVLPMAGATVALPAAGAMLLTAALAGSKQ